MCVEQIKRRCVPNEEIENIFRHYHTLECGGHFGESRIVTKVLQSRFYWLTLFRDDHVFVVDCDCCQWLGNISRRNKMPLNTIMEVELFDIWGIDFMGPFPSSYNKHILLEVGYVSKWVEEVATPTNDAKVV